jgi:GDSL-like Lipase/Acylhydrolase
MKRIPRSLKITLLVSRIFARKYKEVTDMWRRPALFALALTLVILVVPAARKATGQTSSALFVGMGDSIGEGVQSADANLFTQPFSFLNLIAVRMSAPFPIPLIRTSPVASVSSVLGRSRIDPAVRTFNLAVSGADTESLLNDAATATDVSQIASETDLVLFPWLGSQMQVAEQLRPARVACWIGNNDALGSVLAFDHLDASQLTPVTDFTARFTEIADRLQAMGSAVVFGTIPDVTRIAFLVDRTDLIRFLGSDFGLPADSRTSLEALVLVKLGLANATIFSDPNFVLDANELQTISAHVNALNDVIRNVAAAHGMAVADIHAVFDFVASNPPVVVGVPLTTRFLGGAFSLDGVHPSNIAQAIIANIFIDQFNAHYNTNTPPIDNGTLFFLFLTDPFVDKDGDGRVTGRPGAGLLETLSPLLGFSGDLNDFLPPALSFSASLLQTTGANAAVTETAATKFFNQYQRLTGRDLRKMSRTEQFKALGALFDPGTRK